MKNESSLQGIKVAILVTDGFEQVEMTYPQEALEKAGAQTFIFSDHEGKVQGFNHDEKADQFHVDQTLDHANPNDYHTLLLPGGVINADRIRLNLHAQQIARHFDEEGKPIAVICHGPWLLISAGLVKGRTLTSWPSLQDDIRNAGGIWIDREAVRDRNWVSSRKPDDLPAFNQELMRLIAENLQSVEP